MQAIIRILRIRDDSEQRYRINNCETVQASCVDVNIHSILSLMLGHSSLILNCFHNSGVGYRSIYWNFYLVILLIPARTLFILVVITEEKKVFAHEHLMVLILFSLL